MLSNRIDEPDRAAAPVPRARRPDQRHPRLPSGSNRRQPPRPSRSSGRKLRLVGHALRFLDPIAEVDIGQARPAPARTIWSRMM